MKKEMICVNCPVGCHLVVEVEDGNVLSVTGNRCPKGEAYGRQECIQPMRYLTTTVRIHGAIHRVLPVISEKEIPLEVMQSAMEEVRKIEVEAPVHEGDVVLDNLAGTGVKLIASRSM